MSPRELPVVRLAASLHIGLQRLLKLAQWGRDSITLGYFPNVPSRKIAPIGAVESLNH